MTRVRLAKAALLGAMVAAIFAGASVGTGASLRAAGGFKYTHLFTSTAKLVDRWTINDKSFPYCGRVGNGSITVTFRTTKAWRVTPIVDPTAGLHGRWILAIGREGARGIQDETPRPGLATVTSVDNTTPGPNDPNSEPCRAFDKADCGASQDKHAKVGVTGYDRRRIVVDVRFNVPETGSHGVRCFLGSLEGGFYDQRLGGDVRNGGIFVMMPNPQTFTRRGVVRVTGTSHKRISTRDRGLSATDDVTQTVTLTFTHI